jgi:hypothetical protein
VSAAAFPSAEACALPDSPSRSTPAKFTSGAGGRCGTSEGLGGNEECVSRAGAAAGEAAAPERPMIGVGGAPPITPCAPSFWPHSWQKISVSGLSRPQVMQITPPDGTTAWR